MQIKVIRGSLVLLFIILIIISVFIVPLLLFFLAITTVLSLLAGIQRIFSNKNKPLPQQYTSPGDTIIDVSAQVE